jgi:ubiquinone/menaquinone biosynthesis C-methylase UbiE
VDAIRARFDAAVARAPEAAVALYSLGSPEILARASAEIAARMRDWQLLGPDMRVLDFGCGIGRLARAIAKDVRSVVGIDVSPGMIAEAQRRCSDLANVSFQVGSGRNLEPLATGSFDLVLAVDVFPYLVAAGHDVLQDHLREIARVLRSPGRLLVLNWSYRGDIERDRADVVQLADQLELGIARLGTRDFALWDGLAFLLKKSRRRATA